MVFSGKDLRALRKSLGLTQGEFASVVGSSKWSIVHWERGGPMPPLVQRYFRIVSKRPELLREKELQPA